MTDLIIAAESDAEFFVRLDKEAKEEIIKNKEKDMLKSRLNTLDDDITLVQLKVEIEHRDEEIQELKDELLTLKKELSQVKERNKKLYQILSHGESKFNYNFILTEMIIIFRLLFFIYSYIYLYFFSERQGISISRGGKVTRNS